MIKIEMQFPSIPDMLAFFANTKTLAPLTAIGGEPVADSVVAVKDLNGNIHKGHPVVEDKKPRKEQAQPAVAQNTGSDASVAQPGTTSTEGVAGSTVAEPAAVVGNDAAEPAGSATPVTPDDARKALTELNGLKGLEAAKNALQHFGANRLSDLKAEQYGAFIAYCQAAK